MQVTSIRSTRSNRVNRADLYLQTLVDQGLLTEDGLTWLRQILDPFHDIPQDPSYWPDGVNTQSISEIVEQQIVVRKPATLGPGNWQCHIFTLPLMFTSLISTTGQVALGPGLQLNGWLPVTLPDANTYGLSMLNIHASLDGSLLGVFSLTPNTFVGAIGFPNKYFTGGRLNSFGYEVHNDTSRLNRQGSCVHYKTPCYNSLETVSLCNLAGVSLGTSAAVRELTLPPASVANATQLPGAVKWEAERGNYTVVPFTTLENPPTVPSGEGFYFYNPDTNTTLGANVVNPAFVTTPAVVGFPDQQYIPIATVGSFYSGLSDTTTLTVTAKFTVERFTNIRVAAEAELVRISRFTPPRDQMAMNIYSGAVRKLPLAVFVDENSFGDWFMQVAKDVVKAAIPILATAPHPVAKGVAAAGSILFPLLDAVNNGESKLNSNSNQPKKKKQNQPSPPSGQPKKNNKRKRGNNLPAKS
jgi:hypothetical protein